jgi:anion-transporting  ArsA/GET3 family ATPase
VRSSGCSRSASPPRSALVDPVSASSVLLPEATPASRAVTRLLTQTGLVYISGKGGAGKTTVAAALGLIAAGLARRTVICELAGADQLARGFDARRQADGRARLANGLWSLSVDAQQALRDWLRRQPGGAATDAVLHRSHAFAHFVAAAPGAKELITIGKLVDLATGGETGFDLVIVDGPATGHALGMLGAPRTIGEAVPVGPIGAQARVLHETLADPCETAYVGVSLPDDMSVRETLALERGLIEELDRRLDLIVVDGLYPDRFSDDDAEAITAATRRGEARRLLEPVLAQHRRARRQAEHVRWLRDHTDAPLVTLPFVFSSELGPTAYTQLARELIDG